jgi:hypothetical protein
LPQKILVFGINFTSKIRDEKVEKVKRIEKYLLDAAIILNPIYQRVIYGEMKADEISDFIRLQTAAAPIQ